MSDRAQYTRVARRTLPDDALYLLEESWGYYRPPPVFQFLTVWRRDPSRR